MEAHPARTICQSSTLRLLGNGNGRPVTAVLRYDTTDPFAVHVLFRAGTHASRRDVEWTFARSLLRAGLHGAAGDGDVHLQCEQAAGHPVLRVALRSPSGTAALDADRAEVARFLTATDQAVPPGTELSRCDIDAALRALLAETSGGCAS